MISSLPDCLIHSPALVLVTNQILALPLFQRQRCCQHTNEACLWLRRACDKRTRHKTQQKKVEKLTELGRHVFWDSRPQCKRTFLSKAIILKCILVSFIYHDTCDTIGQMPINIYMFNCQLQNYNLQWL